MNRGLDTVRFAIGLFWLVFQFYIIFVPQVPMVQRPLHLMLALALVLLWSPLDLAWLGRRTRVAIDWLLVLAVVAGAAYFLLSADRLTERMENIDPVFVYDMAIGVAVLVVMLEAVRRVVGWSLLGVILGFLAYGFLGAWFPGWLRFQGFGFAEFIEILTMTANGVLGITTATSVQFVFYFVTFGAIYSATGGGQLFIDLGMRVAGRQKGGAAKASIVSSGLMGSISGSAVANVTATGIFTIPLMRRSGYRAVQAAATEAIASTGGQLMPPIMGVAAFVMAELLQIPYGRIALAGAIPALAFYFAIFLYVDFQARRTGVGTLGAEEIADTPPILPRLHLLIPPVVLVAMLVAGYSATLSAVVGCGACFLAAGLRRASRPRWADVPAIVFDATRQAAQVAVPIAAIGIIIAVAIQSNLALKFSTNLIELSGGTLIGAMGFIILGCIVMGMGLPTVAAYIIGAILFVPAIRDLGIAELPAHFFVMYYSVLSMVTPPVALASYTAAGLARANTMATALLAFKMSLVSFLIPFAFAFDPALLGLGSPGRVVVASVSVLMATAAWAAALVGYIRAPVSPVARALFALASLTVIFWPTGTAPWAAGLSGIVVLFLWCLVLHPRLAAARSREARP